MDQMPTTHGLIIGETRSKQDSQQLGGGVVANTSLMWKVVQGKGIKTSKLENHNFRVIPVCGSMCLLMRAPKKWRMDGLAAQTTTPSWQWLSQSVVRPYARF